MRGGIEDLTGVYLFPRESSPHGGARYSVYNPSHEYCVNAAGKSRFPGRLADMQSVIAWKRVILH